MIDAQNANMPGSNATTKELQINHYHLDPKQRESLNMWSEQLTNIVSAKRRVIDKVETMRRARRAAQVDADSARARWRERLRDSDGTLTRDVQKLRVTERSALSLIEQYQVLELEIAKELPELELRAADAADACIKARKSAIRQAAGQAYELAIAQCAEILSLAFELHFTVENADLNYKNAVDRNDLAERLFGTFGNRVREYTEGDSLRERVVAYLNLPPLDLQDVDIEIVQSPARRGQVRARLRAEVNKNRQDLPVA